MHLKNGRSAGNGACEYTRTTSRVMVASSPKVRFWPDTSTRPENYGYLFVCRYLYVVLTQIPLTLLEADSVKFTKTLKRKFVLQIYILHAPAHNHTFYLRGAVKNSRNSLTLAVWCNTSSYRLDIVLLVSSKSKSLRNAFLRKPRD
jgi:hypothetical protein